MSEKAAVHIGENSPEQVAFKLLEALARIEGKSLFQAKDASGNVTDRKWILDAYAECLKATHGLRYLED
jgi:hypothetical protein